MTAQFRAEKMQKSAVSRRTFHTGPNIEIAGYCDIMQSRGMVSLNINALQIGIDFKEEIFRKQVGSMDATELSNLAMNTLPRYQDIVHSSSNMSVHLIVQISENRTPLLIDLFPVSALRPLQTS